MRRRRMRRRMRRRKKRRDRDGEQKKTEECEGARARRGPPCRLATVSLLLSLMCLARFLVSRAHLLA
eukprot:9469184-Pyramimonas_sp.AAC.1